jgi:hypothetical protein
VRILFSIFCGLVILFVGGCAFIVSGGVGGSGESFFGVLGLMWAIAIANIAFVFLANAKLKKPAKIMTGAAVLYGVIFGAFLFAVPNIPRDVKVIIFMFVLMKAAFASLVGYLNEKSQNS